jgi:signal transduction histidine kinase
MVVGQVGARRPVPGPGRRTAEATLAMGHGRSEELDAPLVADARVLGRLLAAQNVLSVLPTPQAADFCALALTSVPGVREARVCFPGGFARRTAGGGQPAADDACAGCDDPRRPRGQGEPVPRAFTCRQAGASRSCAVPLDTAGQRLGFAVLGVERPEVFGAYLPFVQDLVSFVALALENRSQSEGLVRARTALERRVDERTAELHAAMRLLTEEVEQRRSAEAAARTLNLELEARVRERTAQLQASNQDLEAFAYSVSHDLRAPLRHIGGFVELLERRAAGPLDAQGRHYLAAVSEAARRMDQLIGALLSFSRMGRQELSREPVDLGALAGEVIRELEPEARGREVRWRLGPLPVVAGDRTMLRLALVNLLSNALKFTRPRPVAEIELGQAADAGQQVVFVRDNGVGFDMAYVGKLFGVFERLHPAADFEGTGIGLANVRRIVQRHGGRTWAEGAPGMGATFFLSLPTSEARGGTGG